MDTVRWADVRQKHVDAIGAEEFERGKNQLLAEVRAYRLVEMRKRRGLTQRQVAETLGVTVGRVSQIEKGALSGIEVLERYVAALGGQLHLVADFGEEQFKVS